ncbi:MAG TPA: serine protease [Chitinophagaceae bacterium]|nr:serine protease [Chitinophagaceae bacterium]
MSSKSSTASRPVANGNGHGHGTKTSYEDPPISQKTSQRFESNSGAETEVEEVEGFSISKPWESDREVSNGKEFAAFETQDETSLEETGTILSGSEAQLLDAFYASYSELIPELKEHMQEVVIGPDNRVRINPTTSYPWRAICALKITAQNGSRWIGTGWLVSARTVITAGHCVFMHDQGGWAKSVEVIPAMNDGSRPYGSGSSSVLRSVTGWTQNKNRENDYGAIILPANFRPGAVTGSFGFAVKDDAYLKSSVLNLSGYPGDKGGNQQWFMALKPKSVSSRVITYDIDTMGGQSGAPVWIKVGETRSAVGIHTNGHISGNSATRIVTAVFNNLLTWKNLGL